MGSDSVWVLVPTMDERPNLAILLPQILNQNPEWHVLVVDDRSTDGTRRLLDKSGKGDNRLSAIYRNQAGFGSALREGMAYALHRGATRIVTMDGDLSHDPRDIPRLLARPADLVLGSRYVDGGDVVGWPRRRRAISYLANRLARFSIGSVERDLTTGFRAYSRAMVEIILAESSATRYNFQIEAVNLAKKHRMTIAEEPIVFKERRWGESKLSTSLEAMKLVGFLTTRSPLRLFFLVGLIAVLVNAFVLFALVGVYEFPFLTGGLMAVLAGVITAFVLNEVWTYRGRLPKGRVRRFARYNAVVFAGLLLNLSVLWILTEYANIQYLLSNLFGMGTALSWNYWFMGLLARKL